MGASLIAMPTCKEVARTVAADERADVGWRRRLSIRLHLFLCRHCRSYTRQMRAIGLAAKRDLESKPTKDAALECLRESILSHLPPDRE